MFLQALAALVGEQDLAQGSLYPPLSTIQECSVKIAVKVAGDAYNTGKLSFVFQCNFSHFLILQISPITANSCTVTLLYAIFVT